VIVDNEHSLLDGFTGNPPCTPLLLPSWSETTDFSAPSFFIEAKGSNFLDDAEFRRKPIKHLVIQFVVLR
jgi:hypothetical protein